MSFDMGLFIFFGGFFAGVIISLMLIICGYHFIKEGADNEKSLGERW